MPQHEASRTLVKSTPELWAECSDAASLARHLGAFGEIRITKLEPETAVAWEGDDVSGTVTLEPSGWGTRVILTAESSGSPAETATATEAEAEAHAEAVAAAPPPDPEPEPEVEPVAERPSEPEEQATPEPPAAPEPAQAPEPPASPEPAPKVGFFRRLFGGRRQPAPSPASGNAEPERVNAGLGGSEPIAQPEPAPEAIAAPAPEPEPRPAAAPPVSGEAAALVEALDSLGRAHHRPYSRG